VVGIIEYHDEKCIKKKDLSLELLKRGFGVIYHGGGAEYGGKLAKMKLLEEKAKKDRIGIWEEGTHFETPGEYKAKHKNDCHEGGGHPHVGRDPTTRHEKDKDGFEKVHRTRAKSHTR